jgi:adenosylhomocysteine nucleosidase
MREQSTAGPRPGNTGESWVLPPPAAADVGIVAALPIEVGDLIDGLKKVRKYKSVTVPVIEGEHDGKIVAVAVSGPGRPAARRAAELLLTGHHPRWVISAGFAAALNPAFARNDLVLSHEVIDRDGGHFSIDQPPELTRSIGHRHARLLTVSEVVASAEAKAELRREYEADLVDMETSAVAAICRERLVRFLSIRVISDDARAELPREVATLLPHTGVYQVGAALRALWRRPSSLTDFWRLYEHAIEAADRLAKCLRHGLDDLPP